MIKILHGADLHLDSPFSDFSPETAAQYRRLQRQLPKKLADLCQQLSCRVLLLAGDIFDGIPYPETMEQLRRELELCPVPVLIVPGNHDPLDSGIWDGSWPENVHIFKEPGCVTLDDLGLCVHHGSMDAMRAEDDGYLHVGLIHGDEMPTERRIAATGLDYLAMGHIHKTAMPRKAGSTWYGWPGVPMGRGFDETGEKGVFCVELSKDDCRTQMIVLEAPRYEIFTVEAGSLWQPPADSAEIHGRLRVVGQADLAQVWQLYEDLREQFLTLELADETEPLRDLWEDCGDGTLRGLALDVLKQQGDPALSELAAKYLLAALEGREVP